MRYDNYVLATFREHPNRFIAWVELEGRQEKVHVKNTGRCKELLLPGARVVLTEGQNPNRKTRYDLVAVWKDGLGWVNIDSQAPNKVVQEWLRSGCSPFEGITYLQPEYTYGKSRMDFYLECGARRILLEVKGCTLEVAGQGYFPDAPTERGVRHLQELQGALQQGFESYLVFVIAMPGVKSVLPNLKTHPEFGKVLQAAWQAGVRVIYLTCTVTPDSLTASNYSQKIR